MEPLRTRLFRQKEIVVEEKHLASVMGNVGADVLSTHCVVLLMELATRNAVEEHLGQGQMVVGTWVGIRHLAAVLKGFKVDSRFGVRDFHGKGTACGSSHAE